MQGGGIQRRQKDARNFWVIVIKRVHSRHERPSQLHEIFCQKATRYLLPSFDLAVVVRDLLAFGFRSPRGT